MEEEVLLVVEVIDPKVDRGPIVHGVVDARVDYDKAVEGTEHVIDDVAVVDRRELLAAVASCHGEGPVRVRTIGQRERRSEVGDVGHVLARRGCSRRTDETSIRQDPRVHIGCTA